ncbi:Putative P-loop ATPase [Gloeomargarita lithophora Alchichica-D10]|uniref:P-loop ATPase n=2 Tax=Gloeomargarita TaxID=1188227 RepID=A0A1J0AG15_9CYAN|nr:Putative P-loop ATPase [Gloeomargarita lithophora Alchichica-D10]
MIPVPLTEIDIPSLQRERDGIWAAAVQAYRAGERWWLQGAEYQESERLNQDFLQSDPWQEVIAGKLSIPTAPSQVTTEYVLSDWLNISTDRQGKQEQRRVGAIMRSLGWENSTQRLNGTPKKCWVKNLHGTLHRVSPLDFEAMGQSAGAGDFLWGGLPDLAPTR